jgi:hypothetical protein
MAILADVTLGKTKVNNVKLLGFAFDAHKEVVRLDISVEERFRMHELNPGDHLVCDHEDCF